MAEIDQLLADWLQVRVPPRESIFSSLTSQIRDGTDFCGISNTDLEAFCRRQVSCE